jgi:hypothetical protein
MMPMHAADQTPRMPNGRRTIIESESLQAARRRNRR